MSQRVISPLWRSLQLLCLKCLLRALPEEVIKPGKFESVCLTSTDPDSLQAYN